MSENGNRKLPTSWQPVSLGSVLNLINGRAFKPTEWQQSGLPIIRIQNLNNPDAEFNYYAGDLPNKFRIRNGDLLFAWSGTPGTSFGAHIWRGEDAWLNQHIFKVEFDEKRFSKRFLQHAINQNLEEYIRAAHGGAGLAHITKGRFEQSEILEPPYVEQCRIVDFLESQITRIEAVISSLRRAQANLKRYRASVLKAACEGRLVQTEAEVARNERRDYQPAEILLARILKGRRAKWEATQLTKFKSTGKTPKDDTWKAKYVEPALPETANLQDLPEGWSWTSLRTISELKGGITKGQQRSPDARMQTVPYLRVANVQRGYLDLAEMKEIAATKEEIDELRLIPGDVLFNEGGDRDKLGRGWIWNGELPLCIHQNHVFRARIYECGMDPRLLSWYGNTFGQKYFSDEGKQTTNLASINMTKLGALPVPLPPLAEQYRIVAEVERRLSVVDELESLVNANLKRAERLRQSILQRAFEGKLVPQS